MRRSASGLTAVWLVSCVPVALPALWAPAEASLGEASRAALAVLPWLAWIGLPGAVRSETTRSDRRSSAIGAAALALPPLAAAVAIDLGHGRSVASLLAVALASLAMIVMLGFAATRAELGARAGAFAWTWIVLVPGLPLLRCALEVGGAPGWGRAPRWLAAVADASPIAWAWARAGSMEARGLGAIPWAGLAACVLLLAIAGGRPAEEAT